MAKSSEQEFLTSVSQLDLNKLRFEIKEDIFSLTNKLGETLATFNLTQSEQIELMSEIETKNSESFKKINIEIGKINKGVSENNKKFEVENNSIRAKIQSLDNLYQVDYEKKEKEIKKEISSIKQEIKNINASSNGIRSKNDKEMNKLKMKVKELEESKKKLENLNLQRKAELEEMKTKLEILVTNVETTLKKNSEKDKKRKRKSETNIQESLNIFANSITEQLKQNNLFLMSELAGINRRLDESNGRLDCLERKYERFEQNYNEDKITNRQNYMNIVYNFKELNTKVTRVEERVLKILEKYDIKFDLGNPGISESSRDLSK